MDAAVKVENLTYIYNEGLPGQTVAIEDISFEIPKGEFLGIIGHTGSGKSTLIQHFNGLLKPTRGSVVVNGQDVWADKSKLQQLRFDVGLVFQYPEYQLFEETVFKDIAYGPTNMGLEKDEVERRVREAAAFVKLDEQTLESSPFDLSGGQKRRVAIAGVLAMEPEVLILDEPAAGLDPGGRAEILGEIARYHEQRGITVIIVSHSMEDIARYAKRVMVINEGRLYSYDDVGAVFARAAELKRMGLAVPAVTDIMLKLKERGFAVDPAVYTAEQAARQLLALLKGGGAK